MINIYRNFYKGPHDFGDFREEKIAEWYENRSDKTALLIDTPILDYTMIGNGQILAVHTHFRRDDFLEFIKKCGGKVLGPGPMLVKGTLVVVD